MNAVRRCNIPHWRAPLIHAALHGHTEGLKLSMHGTETEIGFADVTTSHITVTCPFHHLGQAYLGEEGGWTHCEADADGGREGPCDELSLVELNQQRGLAHSAVSH